MALLAEEWQISGSSDVDRLMGSCVPRPRCLETMEVSVVGTVDVVGDTLELSPVDEAQISGRVDMPPRDLRALG